MTAAQILDRALTHIRRGWCQHEFVDAYGRNCVIGALAGAKSFTEYFTSAEFRDPEAFAALDALATAIGAARRRPAGRAALELDIALWNDSPSRRQEDVIAALELALIILEQQRVAELAPMHEQMVG